MDNNFKILLQAQIDTSGKDINQQLANIQKTIEPLGIQLKIDNTQLKTLQDSLLKLSKTSDTFKIDSKGVEQLTKTVSTMKDEFGNSVTTVEKLNKKTGEMQKVTQTVTSEYEKQSKAQERLVEQMAKGRERIEDLSKQKEKLELEKQSLAINKSLEDSYKDQQSLADKMADGREKAELESKKRNLEWELNQQRAINKAIDERYESNKKELKQVEDMKLKLEEFKKLQTSRLDSISGKSGADITEVARLRAELDKLDASSDDVSRSMKSLSNDITVLGRNATQSSKSIGSMVAQYFTMYELFNATKRITSDMINVLFSVDEQMIGLKKVTDETTASYDRFLTSASKMGIELASTTDDVIAATANFAKLGADSFEQAQQLAEVALIYANVADGLNATDASKSIVATMSAFRIEAENAIEIVDKANEVSNRYAIDSKGIADALSVSSNALANANNDLASSIALITTANTTAQDPSRVGNAMKTISLNLRAVSEESGKAIAGMREYIQTISGVDIMVDDTTFKSTYDIILELSKKWDSFTDLVQADIATTLSGKHRTDVFLSLMNSADQLESVYNTAMDSTGSATREMEARMQGLDAKLNQVKVSFEQLSLTTINSDFVKGTLDATSSLLQFLDATGGLIPVATSVIGLITTIKSQNIAGSIVATGKSIGTLSSNVVNSGKAMLGFGTSMNAAKTATIGFGTALNVAVPIIGLLATGLSLVSMGVSKYNADMEELRQKNIEMVDTLSQEQDKLRDIQGQYEKANSMTDGSIEKKKELERIQQLLIGSFGAEASEIDLVNGKYSDQISTIQELIGEKSQLQQILAQQNLDDAKNKLNDATNTEWNFDVSLKANPESIQRAFEDVKNEFGDKFESMVVKNPFGDDAATTTMWKINTENADEYNEILMAMMVNMQKYGANSSDLFSKIMKDGETYANTLSDIKDMEYAKTKAQAQATVTSEMAAKSISDTSKATKEQYESMKSDIIRKYSDGVGDAAENQTLLSESIKELNARFPQFSDAIKESDENANAQKTTVKELQERLESLQDTYAKTTSSMKELKDIQEEYDKYGAISQNSMNKIISNYPELLSAMGDEASFREMLIEIMGEQKSAQETALTELTLLQNQYAQDIKLIDAQLYEELLQYYQVYSDNYADAMEGSVEAWGKMSQAQADITTTLIDKLGVAWKAYFSAIAQGFDALGSSISTISDNKITHQSDFTEEQWNSLSGLEKQRIENMKETVRTTTEAGKQFTAIGEALSNVVGDFNSGGIEISIPVEASLGDKKSGSKKDDTAKKIKEALQKELDKIQKERLTVDYKIDFLSAKLDVATLKGDQKEIESLSNQMTELLSKRKELTEAENVQYNALKKKFSDSESLIAIESLMQSNSIEWWSDRKNQLQQESDMLERQIELISEKYELENKAINDRLRDIELEQMMMNDSSDDYAVLQAEKLSLIKQQQNLVLDQMNELRSTNISETSKELEDLKSLYYDYQRDLNNMTKTMAEQRRKIELDAINEQIKNLENQKSAIEDRNKIVMDMIKHEADARKKQIQDEIDGYQTIINKKKDSLQSEKDNRDYQKGLKERENAIKKTEDKILALSNDGSAKAQAEKARLEEELLSLREDLSDYQYDKSVQQQQDRLDEEYENFKSEKDKEIELIDDFLSKEGKIREEALRLIESNNKELYEKLKRWSTEYTTTSMEDLNEMWTTANDAVEEYSKSNQSLLEVMRQITEELKKQQSLQESANNSTWQDYAGNSNSQQGGGGTNPNADVIKKMKDNSGKWATASVAEKDRLSDENQRLGKSIGAYYDDKTGVWYIDSSKKKKLYDTIGVYHTGGIAGVDNMRSVGGVSINPQTEVFAKLMKGEPIITQGQAYNFIEKTLPNLIRSGSTGDIKIDKFVDITVQGNLDKSIDIESIIKRASSQAIDRLMNSLSNSGLNPRIGF